MKVKEKILIFLFLLTYILTGNSYNIIAHNNDLELNRSIQRVVLVELFVQTTCITCPHAEFCLEELSWEYGNENLILVEEHLWNDGYDTPETNARYNWYVGEGKKGTPDLFINGLTHRIQGLACEDIDENYNYYKNLIDFELARPSLIEISVLKTISNSTIIIEGKIKNISKITLENIVVCGMIYKEGEETGLYFWVKDIFPFKDIPLMLPQESFTFKFTSEPLLLQKDDKNKFHAVIFVQDIETKEVLQALYID